MKKPKLNLQQRVFAAAETVFKREKSIGPIELLLQLRFLDDWHIKQWKIGHPSYLTLQNHIQCGGKKLKQTYALFLDWVQQKGLEPFTVDYMMSTRNGPQKLTVCLAENSEREPFFRTHFRSAGLTEKQQQRLSEKKNKAADLVVFQAVGNDGQCAECSARIPKEELFLLEQQNTICLQCADLAHLEFLPSGNATLTRRARKHSSLSAIVRRFNSRRKRYDRLGLLVSGAAIDAAYAQNAGDHDARAIARAKAAESRKRQDAELVEKMAELIVTDFPLCPHEEAQQIAAHTAERGSGRVGRSQAGRDLDAKAIQLAVIAWIRHQHTPYDKLLMSGVARREARKAISEELESTLTSWRGG